MEEGESDPDGTIAARPFALETTIEHHGIFLPEKVAGVRGKKSGDIVADVRMTEEGLFDVHRVAEATSKATGERLSKTRDDTKGFVFPERVANTYDKNGRQTHETTRQEEGILFRRRFTEARRTEDRNAHEGHPLRTVRLGYRQKAVIVGEE